MMFIGIIIRTVTVIANFVLYFLTTLFALMFLARIMPMTRGRRLYRSEHSEHAYMLISGVTIVTPIRNDPGRVRSPHANVWASSSQITSPRERRPE